MIAKKPFRKDPEDFIRGARADQHLLQDQSEGKKEKTFLLRIPYNIWDQARRKAGAQATSLHNYIIQALQEKNSHG